VVVAYSRSWLVEGQAVSCCRMVCSGLGEGHFVEGIGQHSSSLAYTDLEGCWVEYMGYLKEEQDCFVS
jgi:hypothetical protein